MIDTIHEELQNDGYVVLPEFLQPEECDELVAAGLQFSKDAAELKPKHVFSSLNSEKQQNNNKYFMESNDKISYFFEAGAVGPDDDLIVDPSISLNKVGHALHYLHPMFRCYTYCSRVKNVCKALNLKMPAVVQSMYIYKNPGTGSEVKPHQDATYVYTDPIPPIGFWIALQDATIDNGCLWISKGSHKSGVHQRLIRNPDKNSQQALVYDKPVSIYPESSFRPVPVQRGTCILLHGNVVHKSAPNKSNNSRHAYTFHVIEKQGNEYSKDNWLQEGSNAPFSNIYETPQLI